MAVKVVDKKSISESTLSKFNYEASILNTCKHRQIVKVLEVFETSDHLFMVTQFCKGGDLQNYVMNRDYEVVDEKTTKKFAYKLG